MKSNLLPLKGWPYKADMYTLRERLLGSCWKLLSGEMGV